MRTIRTWRACCLLGLLLFAANLSAKPDGPNEEAKKRLVLYQAETRAVLTHNHWRVAKDQPGRLVATCPLGPQGASFGNSMPDTPMMVYLTITFQPRTMDHTDCAASIVAYIYNKSPTDIQRHWSEPIPFNNAESKKQIQEMMAEAEEHLAKNHPEYARK